MSCVHVDGEMGLTREGRGSSESGEIAVRRVSVFKMEEDLQCN